MTGLANNPLQKAVYDALVGNAPLMAKVTGVYDEPDEKAPLPIVVIGDGTTVDNSTKTEDGQAHTITIHAWSGAHGRMELKDIMGLIYDVLHNSTLTVTGHSVVLIRFEFSEDFRELEDERTLNHSVMRFRVNTEKI